MDLKPVELPKSRVLVAEEDPVFRAGLCSLLADAGYTLAKSTPPHGRFDLVLAGTRPCQPPEAALHLPDRAVPVILLVDHAAWTGFNFLDAANDLGAVAVLQRPFTRTALLRLIAKVLSEPASDAVAADEIGDGVPRLAELLRALENPNPA
jgi:CheY-like chemotaxis protein